jgi:glycosyltransferase involved in cell wall biosynthesis
VRVLLLNRRDIRNPLGGGAEVYTHEVAKGLGARGAEVTVFASTWEGAPPEETVDGIRHIRRGSELSVHLHGFLHAWRNRKLYDVIVDQFNGLGFFGFLIPGKVIMLIHQMYREFWFRELGRVGGAIPYVIEPLLLRCYRRIPVVTVSPSTRADLERLGLREVYVVMNALSGKALDAVPEKEARPTFMFLGRLRATKRPEDAVRIYRRVKAEMPEAQLWIAGTGPAEGGVRREAEGLADVTFLGHCAEDEKFRLLARAHVLLVPGVREGFGINVIEAASQGTPAVGYDIPGLRDSIRDGRTGLLAHGAEEAAQLAVGLLRDPGRYREMCEACLAYARDFTWEKRAEEFWETLNSSSALLRDR